MLVDLPVEKIPELCTILEKEWPLTMDVVNLMKRWKSWRDRGITCPENISLLYSKNNEQSGVFFVVQKSLNRPLVSLSALDGYDENLKAELLNLDVWAADEVSFMHVLEKHMPSIEKISTIKSYKEVTSSRYMYHSFSIPVEDALKLTIDCPEDVEFGPLSENHIDEMYETWVFKMIYSIDDLKWWYKLDKKYAIGIFCKKSGALLSRCLRSPAGWISTLQTIESARRKGYAQLLMKKVSKMMAEDSIEPCTFTIAHNEAALQILDKGLNVMLVNLPAEKTPELCTILEKEWPLTMDPINLMKRWKSWKDRGIPYPDSISLRLLYSKNNEKSGVFFVVQEGLNRPVVSLFALDGYDENLKAELMSLDVWAADKVSFVHILEKHVPLIEEISIIKGYKKVTSWKCRSFSIPVQDALKLIVDCPADVEFGPLSENHIDEMYETWILKHRYSVEDLKWWYKLDKKYAVGIFCKKTGVLLSRCLRSPAGWISTLQTIESARQKGYARLLVKKVSKMMAEDSIEPCTSTLAEDNDASLRIFSNVGFKRKYDFVNLEFEKNISMTAET